MVLVKREKPDLQALLHIGIVLSKTRQCWVREGVGRCLLILTLEHNAPESFNDIRETVFQVGSYLRNRDHLPYIERHLEKIRRIGAVGDLEQDPYRGGDITSVIETIHARYRRRSKIYLDIAI